MISIAHGIMVMHLPAVSSLWAYAIVLVTVFIRVYRGASHTYTSWRWQCQQTTISSVHSSAILPAEHVPRLAIQASSVGGVKLPLMH
jgi:hypothetical protein